MSLLTALALLLPLNEVTASQPEPFASTLRPIPGLGSLRWRRGESTGPLTAGTGGAVSVSPGAPVPPARLLGPTFAIDNHGLGLLSSGAVVGWGRNDSGQASPPPALGVVLGLRVGQNHSYARLANGTLVGWGANTWGQTATPFNLGPVRAFSSGADHNSAIRSNRQVSVWGCENCPFDFGSGDVPPGVDGVVQVDAEGPVTIVLLDDGSVVAWGDQTPSNWPFPPISCGQSDTPNLSGVVRIAAGTLHGLALLQDGSIEAWGAECGSSDYGQADVPAGLPPAVDIAAGAQHSLALLEDGTVVGWGLNGNGQTDPPAFLTDVVAIDARGFRSAALQADGTLVIWGDTSEGVGSPPPGPYAF